MVSAPFPASGPCGLGGAEWGGWPSRARHRAESGQVRGGGGWEMADGRNWLLPPRTEKQHLWGNRTALPVGFSASIPSSMSASDNAGPSAASTVNLIDDFVFRVCRRRSGSLPPPSSPHVSVAGEDAVAKKESTKCRNRESPPWAAPSHLGEGAWGALGPP